MELSTVACQVSRDRITDADIYQGTLANAALPNQSFDFITMVDMVYYLPNPKRDFQIISRLLKPSGIALIEAQNFSNRGPVYWWLNHHFDDTWMYFYTPRSLEKMLNRAGLKVIDRIDLPGHRLGSSNFLSRCITLGESAIFKAIKRISSNRLDFVPHFVQVAKPL